MPQKEMSVKKHLSSILILLMFVVGGALLLYPVIGDYLNYRHSSKVISMYNTALESASKERLEELIAEAEEYNDALRNTPGSFADPSLVPGYEQALDITGTGIMGYIDIDKINVELPIYHGVSKGVLQSGVGHIEGSSLPIGGEGNHCILSGHRGLPSAKLFTDLDKLEIGDRFTITVLDKILTYEVDQIRIVLPDEVKDLQAVPEKDYCTLVTCTPYGINTHRLLVRGSRVDDGSVSDKRVFVANEAFKIDTIIVAPFMAIPMVIIVIVAVFVKTGRKDRSTKRRKKGNEES